MTDTLLLPSVSQSRPAARPPTQARSRARVERILASTEALLELHPLEDITAAMISDHCGVKRATIYQFFPSVRTILDTLGQRFLDELYEDFAGCAEGRGAAGWRETLDRIVDTTVDFYSHHPAACSLFLGDGSLHGLRVIDQDFDRRFVTRIQALLGADGAADAAAASDPVQIVITITISVLSLSVHIHRRITDAFRLEAKRVARSYLEAVRFGG